jgi:hypothetical protein
LSYELESVDADALETIATNVDRLQAVESTERAFRLDVYVFFSFDLVGSTNLKSRTLVGYNWIDVIKYFYARCEDLLRSFQVTDAIVWKYIGDEVAFYRRITCPDQIEQAVSAIFRCLEAFVLELPQSKYGDAAEYISIKAISWLAPIKSYVDGLHADKVRAFKEVSDGFKGDDQLIEQESKIDFLGPNIDAGFRLAIFARKKQLVLSPALAYYLKTTNARSNDLRIVAFDHLKGVAGGALYPGIWYHENWSKIRSAFSYEERHGDDLVKDVCAGTLEPLEALDEVYDRLREYGYFFEKELIDRIMNL